MMVTPAVELGRPHGWAAGDWKRPPDNGCDLVTRGFAASRLTYPAADNETPLPPGPRRPRSCRRFAGTGLESRFRHDIFKALVAAGPTAAYPSAGSLYPCHPFVVEPDDHQSAVVTYVDGAVPVARPINRIASRTVREALFEEWAWPVGCLFLVVVEFGRVMALYGDRGLRFALIESGVIAERVREAAENAGLGTCIVGGYDDERMLACVGLQPQWFGVAIALAVGYRQ